MHCTKCGNEVQKSYKFCPHCGEEVTIIETGKSGVSIGDVGLIRGETIQIGAGEGAKAPGGDYCPICGVWAKTEESFRCRDCGRANLHVEHRDQALGVCADCARELRPETLPAPFKPEEEISKVRIEGDELVVILAPAVEMVFVRVSAGVFLMGDDNFKVHLDEYWIGKYPVTNCHYRVYVESSGKKAPSDWENNQIPPGKAEHPVVYVSWHDAQAFCKWAARFSGERIRLPTEAEWEKAARGMDGRVYPWGDQELDVGLCNFQDNNIGDTSRVGQYSPGGDSPYGCADMVGNVWEWTSSLYKDCTYQAGDGREDPGAEGRRVLRGGSWADEHWDVHAASRDWAYPNDSDFHYGFRCARSP
jgi:formylglycine-generating enzyme required for sulfatase activity